MEKNNSKKRLFEVMSRVDKTFKPKLNEAVPESLTYNDVVAKINALGERKFDGGVAKVIQEKDVDPNQLQTLKQSVGLPLYILNWNGTQMNYSGVLNAYGQQIPNVMLQQIIAILKWEQPATQQQPVTEEEMYNEPFPREETSDVDEMANWGKTKANPKYTHFAVLRNIDPSVDGKVVNGWEYGGYDGAELRQYKNDYFFNDIRDMQIDPKNVNVVTAKYLQRSGIDPFDFINWYKYDKDGFTDEIFTL